MATTRRQYGEHRSQFCDLHLSNEARRWPVAVLIHGGFWHERYGLDLMHALIPTVIEAGWAVWNVEYRRIGGDGGYPATFADVAAAVDLLADASDTLDLSRVVAIGHSAGGHLALWAASRHRLETDDVGANPKVQPRRAIAVAGMGDLVAAAPLGQGSPGLLMGVAPAQDPERWRVASPAARLPLAVPQVLVHGQDDLVVPVDASLSYADKARAAGDDVVVDLVPEEDHFAVLDPTSDSWARVLDHLGTG